MSQKVDVGGQAVIEGIMMRSPHSLAIAVRRRSGEIAIVERPWESVSDKLKFLKRPFLRGAVVLFEALLNGIQALTFSADQAMEGMEEEERLAKAGAADPPRATAAEPENAAPAKAGSGSRFMLYLTIFLSLLIGFAVFKGIPHLLTTLFGLQTDQMLFHFIDGAIKISMFIGYVMLVGRMQEMRRVFQYHGAEHKAIFAYENGEELTVENARKYVRFHPRCGTSFIIIVLISSILVFMVVFPFIPTLNPNRFINALLQIAIKFPLMFPVACVAYEFQKWSARNMTNPVVALLVKPGIWLQHVTTQEPDDAQIEIALAALRKTLWREEHGGAPDPAAGTVIETYRNLSEIPL